MQDIIAKAKAILAEAKDRIRSMRRNASEEAEELAHEVEAEETFVTETAKETFRQRFESFRENIASMTAKLSFKERIAIIFVIGFIVGFGMKTAANGYVTIGYRDYTAKNVATYDLIELQKRVAENGSGSAFSGGAAAGGGTCSQ